MKNFPLEITQENYILNFRINTFALILLALVCDKIISIFLFSPPSNKVLSQLCVI